MPAEKIPTAHASFRIPYSAMDVYVDEKSGQAYQGDELDDNARDRLKRDRALSQARYDAWLADFKQMAAKAMPSFKDVDDRPRPGERVILQSRLFRVTVESENWCFVVRLSAEPNMKSRGLQAAKFPRFCRLLRSVLLACGPSSGALIKRNQTTFVPVSDMSDADLDAMAKAARMRFGDRRGSVKGFNEPEKPKKRGRGETDPPAAPTNTEQEVRNE